MGDGVDVVDDVSDELESVFENVADQLADGQSPLLRLRLEELFELVVDAGLDDFVLPLRRGFTRRHDDFCTTKTSTEPRLAVTDFLIL